MTDATLIGLPLIYLIGPLVVFGPILFFVAYSLGLGGLFRKSEGPAIAGGGAERRAHDLVVRAARDRAWFRDRKSAHGTGILARLGQAILFLPFLVFIAMFADGPDHRVIGAGEALVKLSLSHAGQRVEECRRLSRAELEALSPNMRNPMKCARERWPVTVTLWLDDAKLYETTATPSGLSDDGPSVIYQTFPVPAGQHRLRVRLLDSGADTAVPFESTTTLDLVAGQVLAIGFDETKNRIKFR